MTARPLNRFDRNLLRPEQITTYEIDAPKATHHRPATCEEYGCLRDRKSVV